MKSFILGSILMLLFMGACRKSTHRMEYGEGDEGYAMIVDTTPKATAIFWVDKHIKEYPNAKGRKRHIRTVKAKVNIDSAGCVQVLSYVKPQSAEVQEYLKHRLKMFRVTPVMLDSGFVKPGTQYVQLRYEPRKMQ